MYDSFSMRSLKVLPHIVFMKSSVEQFSVYKFSLETVCSRVINPLLTKLARDRTGRISVLGLFCTDLAALGRYCQDLGPIFSQYGPRAWLIRCMYLTKYRKQLINKMSERAYKISENGNSRKLIPESRTEGLFF